MTEPIVLVSGLPRSGTSMIMQMLEAGGIEVLSDSVRSADEDNPRGYYELEAVKNTRQDPSWLDRAPGKAVKLISQLLYDLPPGTEARVLFLRRDMGEILASQRRMLQRRAAADGGVADDADLSRIFEAHVRDVVRWTQEREGLELLEVWHSDVLAHPARVAGQIQSFLGRELDVQAMAAAVDSGLHRNRVGG